MHFHRLIALFTLAILIAILLAACSEPVDNPAIPDQNFQIDPQFRDLYERGGADQTFGPVISTTFSYDQITYQYTVAGLFNHDPQLPEPASTGLAALGLDLGVLEVAVPPPDDETLHYVDGHVIDPSFWPLYQQLGGSRVVGPPLTESRYNPKKGRVEQYFQNLGFYRPGDYPGGASGLLAYGAWKCGQSCSVPGLSITDAEVEPPSPVHPDFRKSVERLGLHFTGFALGPATIAADGWREQIYENVILAMPQEPGGRVIFRPIPASLGILAEPPVPPSSDSEMFFYPIDQGLGHNVPQVFLNYLAEHGGLDASGPPITERTEISTGVFRQCFTNLCLEEHRQETAPMRIRATPLGFLCWQASCTPQAQALPPAPIPSEVEATSTPLPYPLDTQSISQPVEGGVILHVWKKFPILAPDQRQEIGAIVLQNGVPLPGLSAELTVMMPESENLKINLQPTGEDGQSFYQMDLIQAPPGSPINFQVCVYLQAGEATCVQDSFLFWK